MCRCTSAPRRQHTSACRHVFISFSDWPCETTGALVYIGKAGRRTVRRRVYTPDKERVARRLAESRRSCCRVISPTTDRRNENTPAGPG